MSFTATGDDVFRLLIDRLNLKRLQREPVTVPSMIVPVISVDDLIRSSEYVLVEESEGSVAAMHTAEVPDGERWHIIAMSGERDNAGDAKLFVSDPTPKSVVLKRFASGTEFEWDEGITLDAGWTINLSYGVGTSGDFKTSVMYEVDQL